MDFNLTHTLVYLAGIAIVVVLGIIGTMVNQLMGIRVQRPRFQLVERTNLPGYLQELFDQAESQLSALGFEYHHYQLSSDIVAHARSEKFSMVMVNRDTKVFAEVSPASSFVDLPGFETDFWSIAKDGTVLFTVNGRGHTLLCAIPGAEIHDPMATSLQEQYDAHVLEQKVVFGHKQLVLPNEKVYLKLHQKLMDGYFVNLFQEGCLVSMGNNQFRLTLNKTIRLLRQLIRGESRSQQLIRKRLAEENILQQEKTTASDPETTDELPGQFPVETEVQAYLRMSSARERNPAGMLNKIVIFIITLAISYVAFGLVFSFHSVVILLAVILFHELGHIAAMYFFKYRDLQILFIPLIGAAATGKKHDIAVWKQVIVYLMGPLPGIFLGITLIILHQTYQAEWLYETAIIMLVINYLNLLPFIPLDGGHIIRLTVMERFPTGKLLFSGLSGIAFAVGGWFMSEPLFWVLAIAMFATLPMSALEAGVLHELFLPPHSIDDLDKESKITRIFETLKQTKFRKMNFSQKYSLVNSLTDILFQSKHLGRMGSLGLTGIYLVALFLTPPAILVSMVGWQNSFNAVTLLGGEIPQRDWDRDIANADTSEQRFEIILNAAQFYSATNELSRALSYLEKAERSLAAVESDDTLARLYEAYWIYYQRLNNINQSATYLMKAIEVRERRAEENYAELASNYQALANLKLQLKDTASVEEYLKNALDYAIKIKSPEDRFMISNVLNQLLNLYYTQNKTLLAQSILQRILPDLIELTDPFNSYVSSFVYQELGWLYVEKEEYKTAIKQFKFAMTVLNDSTQFSSTDETGTTKVDPFSLINLNLAIAAVQTKQRNITVAKDYMDKAEKLAKENYFDSLTQYIRDYLPEVTAKNSEGDGTRDSARWKLIEESYRVIYPQPFEEKQK